MDNKFDFLVASLKDVRSFHDRRRWTISEIERLKATLNSFGLLIISDAIGSLQFDLMDAARKEARLALQSEE